MKKILNNTWTWFKGTSLKTKGMIAVGIIVFIMVLKNIFKAAESPEITSEYPFPPIVLPAQRLRNDSLGLGHYGARRDGGLRTHEGIDILVYEGQPIYSPFAGILTREFYPYTSDTRFFGFEIAGTNTPLKIKIMYGRAIKNKIGLAVKAGELVGYAQAISKRYSPLMKDHLHVELYDNGIRIDPTTHIQLVD